MADLSADEHHHPRQGSGNSRRDWFWRSSSSSRLSKARLLTQIYETAGSSIGLPLAPGSPAITMFSMMVAEGRLIRQRDVLEAQALLSENADYNRLCQVPGICPINAMTILSEAGDRRRFAHHRQFLKFCGLDLATHQSGQFHGPPCFPSSTTPG